MNKDHIDTAVTAAASKATYAGAAVTGAGKVLNAETVMLIGLIVTIAGFLVNVFFQWRRDRRERREHEARMAERGMYD